MAQSYDRIEGFLYRPKPEDRFKPELKYTNTGRAVISFSISYIRSRRDENGQWVEKPAYRRCQAWGEIAEHIAALLEGMTGDYVFVQLLGENSINEYGDTESGEKKTNLRFTVDQMYVDVSAIAGGRVKKENKPKPSKSGDDWLDGAI